MSISTQQEAVMGNSVPAQHPAVVLRSRYRQLRSLLAVMVVAVVGLSTTVVVLSLDDENATTTTTVHVPTAQLGDPLQERTQPSRESGKPDEGAVAAAISQSGGRSYPTLNDPFQSQVEQPRPQGGVEESDIAAAIGSKPTSVSAPDEAKIAASLAEHSDVGPVARAKAYQEALRAMTPKQLERAYGVR
jgi:hypothetical protein